ncbi:MAG: hypothetical protein ACTSQF_01805 [Candidatus Heimdallarchaeaceae archaeon]
MLNLPKFIYKLQKARPRQNFVLIIKRILARERFVLIIKYMLPLLAAAAIGIVSLAPLFIRTVI